MQIETRNLGLPVQANIHDEVARAFQAALDRFDDRVRRVRVRLLTAGTHQATCRARMWCGEGPTVVVEEHATCASDAIHRVADALNRALRQRWTSRRAGRRRGRPLPGSSRKEPS